MDRLLILWTLRRQAVLIMLIGFQFYLAVSTEVVDEALKNVERVSQWPIQALNIGLFVLVLGICWLYLRSTRSDLQKLQALNEVERTKHTEDLHELIVNTNKTIERNNVLFERMDKRLERLEAASGQYQVPQAMRRSKPSNPNEG